MGKKIYFGSNLKMYKTVQDTMYYLQELDNRTKKIRLDYPEIQIFIIPSYTALDAASKCIDQSSIRIGAQNMCWEDEGQFTGEISPKMLKELNITLIMSGHSERRSIFKENNFEENRKMISAISHDFTGLLCVGESMEEKEYGIGNEVIRTQLKIGLHKILPKDLDKVWIAYEPVWSIGVNGTPASAEYAEEKHEVIKRTLRELYGEEGDMIPVLYGGSVNPSNASWLLKQNSVDGLFVGRSAWDAEKFASLIKDALDSYYSL